VVAQIYGVGLITTRLSGLAFEVGIFVGLGGILVCSFLGGMRAVTWTQVAQYIILIVAYMIPVVWLSVKQTGVPIPQAIYGYQLEKVTAKEKQLIDDPKEKEVIAIFKKQSDDLAAKLKDVPAALAADKAAAEKKIEELKAANAPLADVQAAEKGAGRGAQGCRCAKKAWTAAKAAADGRAKPLAGMPRHAAQYAGDPNGDEKAQKTFNESRRNFLALVFCLMVGTAALPHILMRYYTTPSVKDARASVTWSLFFIFLLYFTAPALAVLVKYEVFNVLVGTPFDKLPAWIASWTKVDPACCPWWTSTRTASSSWVRCASVATSSCWPRRKSVACPTSSRAWWLPGGLAAALSTADGLLLTIANALSHDLYYKMIDPNAPTARRVMISKVLLLVVAWRRPSWQRRNRRTSCSWCRRRSRSRRRPSSRR
jgi:cation/acetate symporter